VRGTSRLESRETTAAVAVVTLVSYGSGGGGEGCDDDDGGDGSEGCGTVTLVDIIMYTEDLVNPPYASRPIQWNKLNNIGGQTKRYGRLPMEEKMDPRFRV
jgi:hypothetical protein